MKNKDMTYTLFLDFKLDDESMMRYRIPNVDPAVKKEKIKNVMDVMIMNQEIFELEGKRIVECLGAKIEGKSTKEV